MRIENRIYQVASDPSRRQLNCILEDINSETWILTQSQPKCVSVVFDIYLHLM
jgi:hypothetical protein